MNLLHHILWQTIAQSNACKAYSTKKLYLSIYSDIAFDNKKDARAVICNFGISIFEYQKTHLHTHLANKQLGEAKAKANRPLQNVEWRRRKPCAAKLRDNNLAYKCRNPDDYKHFIC